MDRIRNRVNQVFIRKAVVICLLVFWRMLPGYSQQLATLEREFSRPGREYLREEQRRVDNDERIYDNIVRDFNLEVKTETRNEEQRLRRAGNDIRRDLVEAIQDQRRADSGAQRDIRQEFRQEDTVHRSQQTADRRQQTLATSRQTRDLNVARQRENTTRTEQVRQQILEEIENVRATARANE